MQKRWVTKGLEAARSGGVGRHRVRWQMNEPIDGAIMATVSLSATPRTDFGKGAARKIRAQGLLPAVIYRAGQPATSIVLDPLALETAFRRSGNRNTLVDLGVDGSNYVCLVKETQRDPVSASCSTSTWAKWPTRSPWSSLCPWRPKAPALLRAASSA